MVWPILHPWAFSTDPDIVSQQSLRHSLWFNHTILAAALSCFSTCCFLVSLSKDIKAEAEHLFFKCPTNCSAHNRCPIHACWINGKWDTSLKLYEGSEILLASSPPSNVVFWITVPGKQLGDRRTSSSVNCWAGWEGAPRSWERSQSLGLLLP